MSLRFTLRTLFVAVTIASVLAYWGSRSEQQRQAVAALRTLDEYECVFYSFDTEGPCAKELGRRFEPGEWAERIGVDFFYGATNVFVKVEELDAALPQLKRLPSLREVYVRDLIEDDSESSQVGPSIRVKSAIERLRRELPGVKVDASYGCPILVSPIPVVG